MKREISASKFRDFVRESNKIEGILREPTKSEIEWTEWFVLYAPISVSSLRQLVDIYQPGIKIRSHFGMNVRVGNHFPPKGGPEIVTALKDLLKSIENYELNPYEAHVEYETLHPFMDGNGRSGRALWAKHMQLNKNDPYWLDRGFLHTFYYQALQNGGR